VELAVEDFVVLFFQGGGILLCFLTGAAILIRKDGNQQANKLLAILIFLAALSFLNGFLAMAGVYNQYQHLYFIPLNYSFSFGPLFYFFVKTKVNPSFRFTKKELIHFIPALIQAVFFFAIGFRSAEYKAMIWREWYGPYLQYIDEGGFLLITLIYLGLSKNLVADAPGADWKESVYRWLRQFIRYFALLLGIIAVYTVAEWMLWLGFEINLYNIRLIDLPLKLSYAAISIWLAVNAWLYAHQSLIVERKITPSDLSRSLAQKVDRLFEEEKVFLNPDFDLDMLSKLTGKTRNDLSAFFSQRGTSFNEVLNKYRVDSFLEMAQNHPQYSLESLALDAGFGSRSTFNRAFKKEKGVSPSTFLRSTRD
jgi:AraC-like DNA-binding protein